MPTPHWYDYAIVRVVPRPEREEFLNVGVVLFCEEAGFLQAACHVDEQRLLALDPRVDLAQVRSGLEFVTDVCAGDERAGPAGLGSRGTRFGFLKAPRSTVLRPGPVHGGVTGDPARQLDRLLDQLVS